MMTVSNNFKIGSEGLKLVPTNEKNSPRKTNIPNIKHIVEVVLKSKKLPSIIIILAFVGIPNIKRIVRDFLRPKKLSSIIMTFVGIYVFRNFIIKQGHNSGENENLTIHYYSGQDQKTDKNETCEQNPGE